MWAYAQWSQTQPIKKKEKKQPGGWIFSEVISEGGTHASEILQASKQSRLMRLTSQISVCVCCFSFIVIFDQFQIWRVQIMAVRSCELPRSPPPLRHPSDAINAVVQDMEKDESADKLLCNVNYNTLPLRPSPLLRYTNRKWLVPARQRGISAPRPRERSRDHIASRRSFWVSTDTNLTLAAGFAVTTNNVGLCKKTRSLQRGGKEMFAGFVKVGVTSLLMEDSVQQLRLFPFISFLDLIKTQFFWSGEVRTFATKNKEINKRRIAAPPPAVNLSEPSPYICIMIEDKGRIHSHFSSFYRCTAFGLKPDN